MTATHLSGPPEGGPYGVRTSGHYLKCRRAAMSLSRRRAAAERTLSAKTNSRAPSAAHTTIEVPQSRSRARSVGKDKGVRVNFKCRGAAANRAPSAAHSMCAKHYANPVKSVTLSNCSDRAGPA